MAGKQKEAQGAALRLEEVKEQLQGTRIVD